MKMREFVPLLLTIVGLGVLAPLARAQTTVASNTSSSIGVDADLPTIKQPQTDLVYLRPTEKMKLRSYLFDTFGPYPVFGAALIGGINQADKTPPEWGQGAGAYGERVGSNFGIAMVTTTARYGLAAAFSGRHAVLPMRVHRIFSQV